MPICSMFSSISWRQVCAVACFPRLWTTEEGAFGVEKLQCARSYHIGVVVRVKSDHAMIVQRCVLHAFLLPECAR